MWNIKHQSSLCNISLAITLLVSIKSESASSIFLSGSLSFIFIRSSFFHRFKRISKGFLWEGRHLCSSVGTGSELSDLTPPLKFFTEKEKKWKTRHIHVHKMSLTFCTKNIWECWSLRKKANSIWLIGTCHFMRIKSSTQNIGERIWTMCTTSGCNYFKRKKQNELIFFFKSI